MKAEADGRGNWVTILFSPIFLHPMHLCFKDLFVFGSQSRGLDSLLKEIADFGEVKWSGERHGLDG